jgi:Protein of unknown function (DUF4232)
MIQRAFLVATALSAGLAACGQAESPPPATPAVEPAPAEVGPVACRSADLQLATAGGDAGMGNRVAVLSVLNRGEGACQLVGYPTVTLADKADRPLGSIEARQHPGNYFSQGDALRPVVVQPGARAYFDLAWNVIPHEGDGEVACPIATTVRVAAPGDGAFAMLPMELTPCGGFVRVSPFRPTAEDEAPASPAA